MLKSEEIKFDVDFLAILMIKQLYVDQVINEATYNKIQERYMKGEQLCQD